MGEDDHGIIILIFMRHGSSRIIRSIIIRSIICIMCSSKSSI